MTIYEKYDTLLEEFESIKDAIMTKLSENPLVRTNENEFEILGFKFVIEFEIKAHKDYSVISTYVLTPSKKYNEFDKYQIKPLSYGGGIDENGQVMYIDGESSESRILPDALLKNVQETYFKKLEDIVKRLK